jgi:CheY-like chemotaxis protein
LARKILLADDSVTAQNMGRKILADAGYEVVTVNNGSAALKRVTESKPDLIVLDVYMPGYSGLEVCQRLKDAPETAHIPVLLTVGKLEPFKPDEARRAQADGHIVKPFEASELLSALARLEDRIVPTDGPRFSTSVAGVERFGGDRGRAVSNDSDTGWKSRLRFPSKKRKEEGEAAEEDAGANFRDFRKGKGKPGGELAPADENRVVRGPQDGAPAASAAARQEPGLVPDIPRDITPEELDALSALAAKLDGPIPATENIASLAEKVGPATTVANGPGSAAAEEEKRAGEAVLAKPPNAQIADFEVPAPTGETVTASATQSSVESAVEAAAAEAGKSALEAPESAEVNTAKVVVSAAAFLETPAPVDQQDEPIFALSSHSAGTVVAPVASSEESAELKAVEASSVASELAVPAETKAQQSHAARAFAVVGVPLGVEQDKDEQSAIEQPVVAESQSESAKTQAEEVLAAAQAGNVAAESSVTPQESAEPEAPAPTDEELAEALRLLTPSAAQPDATIPSHGTLVAAGRMLAEEAARTAGPSPRWVAEAVALTQEESSTSLEEEMFRSFTTQAKPELAGDPEPVTEAGQAAGVASEAVDEMAGSAAVSETAESKSAGFSSTELESGEKVAEVVTASDASEESVPSSTFADATLEAKEEAPAFVETNQAQGAQNVANVESVEDEKSSPDLGGDEHMGKHGKEGSSKSGWHQIRKPASAPAASNVVEAAKQSDADLEDKKAMAAAATAEGGSAGPDASAIASIVDSVLADLRPKIVEEIAKKLGKK